MKSYLYLTKKYIKSYPKRCMSIVLCVSIFLFAFLTILWYSDSFRYSLVKNDEIENGLYNIIDFYADENKVKEKNSELLSEGAGIVSGLWEVDCSKDDIWIADASENVSNILSIKFISGEMPKSENEIAMEKSTYDILNLKSEVGDTVELTVKNSDGSKETKKFILTGITENFTNTINSNIDSTISYSSRVEKFLVPSILTVNTDVKPSYIHVFSESDSILMRNLNSKKTYYNSSREELASKSVVNNLTIISTQIFFVLTTIMGIISISTYFFKEQEQYLNLLRCVGFSKKKSRKLLFIQGFLILISSLIIAVAGSVIVLLLLKLTSSSTDNPLFLNLNPISLMITALLAGVIIFVSLNVLLGRFYKNAPLREAIYVPKKPRKSYTNIKRCWHKAYGRKYRLQNVSSVLIIFFCVLMSIVGSFIPLFNAKGSSFQNPDNFSDEINYSLHMRGGGSSGDSYYINFPVGVGVSHDMADKIMSDDRVRVWEASSSHLCIPFFLTTENPENKMLYRYTVESKKQDYNFEFKHKRSDEMIKLAGGDSNTNKLVELPFKWQTYDFVVNKIKKFSDGKLNKKNYNAGIEAVAPEDLCSVGDEFTMVIQIPDKDANEENIEEHIHFETAKIKVAATYSHDQYDSNELIVSTNYIFSIYPELNYEEISIENLAPNDQEWTKQLEENLETIKNASTGVVYDNYAAMAKEFYDQVNLQTLQIIISVLIFIVIIIIAIIFSSYIQVRLNLKSYITMRAIGAKLETVQKLVINEINHMLNTGIILGTCIGFAVVIFLSFIGINLQLWDIYLFYVAPVFIVTVLLLYFGCHIAVKRTIRTIINENIMEKLNTLE